MDSNPLAIDQQAIIDLTIAYCWALDTREWSMLDRVFTTEATALLGSPELSGLEAIKQRVANALDPLDHSQHMVNTHQVHVDGDTATCRCYFQAQHVRRAAAVDGARPNFIVAGRYEDRLVRTSDGWRIAHRELVGMWTEGNLAVVRGN
jgi:hypothetical protein